ncbi:MAG TPA: Ig-like domain-containing protein, partial [Candidatus Nitrosotalea sp.]|nr:Ig-like domain-containing protein [Candidatus Nitrosotalea sp.]
KSLFSRNIRWVAAAWLVLAMVESVGAATNTVSFGSFFFNPNTLTINVGDTVVWQSAGGAHTVTGTGTDPICGNSTLTSCSHTFNSAGTFAYNCILPGHAQAGMTGSITVVAATNTPPRVTITKPADAAMFAEPADVTIDANASDTEGPVASVRFFLNTTSPGIVTSSPFQLVASNLTAGTYAIRAVALDGGGLSSTSAVVNISVVTPSAITMTLPSVVGSQFQFDYSADVGLRYVVENSPDLANWTPLATNTAASSSERYTETFDVNGLRFYRVERLPNP